MFEAAHDVFSLYGRPQGWSWDPRNPKSLFFGYPVAASRDVRFCFWLDIQTDYSEDFLS